MTETSEATTTAATPADPWVINGPVELVPADQIQPHPSNAREGDIGNLVELIKKNGFYGHCIVQVSTKYILAGNHRYFAGVQAGMTEFPVQWLDVDDEHAIRILLSDNRSSDLASYNTALLVELLESRPTLDGTGFDGDALDELISDLKQSTTAAANEAENKNSGGAPIIQYNIVFETEVEQRKWFEFLNGLRKVYPDCETISGRIVRFLDKHPLVVPSNE